jgi:hypothetical protein
LREIQAEPELNRKILNLLEIISNPNSLLPVATENNTIFDPNESIYDVDCAIIERWDKDFYCKYFLRLVIDWSLEELTAFLNILSSNLLKNGAVIKSSFESVLFIPKFKKVSTVRDWYQQLLPFVQIMDLSHPLTKEPIKKACQGFCLGREDPRFSFVQIGTMEDTTIENQNPTIGYVETLYCRFMKSVLGEFGIQSFTELMDHIKREFNKSKSEEITTANGRENNETKALSKTSEIKPVSSDCLQRLMQILKKLPHEKNEVDLPHLFYLLKIAKEKANEDKLHLFISLEKVLFPKGSESLAELVKDIVDTSLETENDAIMVAETLISIQNLLIGGSDLNQVELNGQQKNSRDRKLLMIECIKKLNDLKDEFAVTVSGTGEKIIDILNSFFVQIYPEKDILIRIALLETAITKLIDGKIKLGETEDIKSNSVVETFLRIVSCTKDLKKSLHGHKLEQNHGFDKEILETNNFIMAKQDQFPFGEIFCSVPNYTDNSPKEFLGGPLLTPDENPCGTLCLLSINNEFNSSDLEFLKVS